MRLWRLKIERRARCGTGASALLAERTKDRLLPPARVDSIGPVVMVSHFDQHQMLRTLQRFVQRDAETRGNDAVVLGDGDNDRPAGRTLRG